MRRLLAVVPLVGVLVGCGAAAVERDLDDARALWATQGFERYVVDVSGTSWCKQPPCSTLRVVVEAGRVVDVRYAPGGPSGDPPPGTRVPTVDGIFEEAERILDRTSNAALMYDPTTGVPTSLSAFEADGTQHSLGASLVLPVPGAAAAGVRACRGEPGSPIDVENGPPWSAWADLWATADGCLVRGDVITSFAGSSHCGLETSHAIVTGSPIGSQMRLEEGQAFADLGSGIWYIRDPEGVIGDRELVSRFDADADLPPGAADTGFRQAGREVWVVPGDADAVYVRDADRIERWPRDPNVVRCE